MMRLWPCKRYVDQFAVYGGGDAVEFRTVQAVIVECDATDRHYIPALAHADNRVIAAKKSEPSSRDVLLAQLMLSVSR